MFIAQHSINFIQSWEKHSQGQDFTLRFPIFPDFLFYLSNHLAEKDYQKLIKNEKFVQSLSKIFYLQLRSYIDEMTILGDEQAVATAL